MKRLCTISVGEGTPGSIDCKSGQIQNPGAGRKSKKINNGLSALGQKN